MEAVVINRSFWKGRRVFVTGHTGFKGAWLCTWLSDLGTETSGYALEPNTEPNLFELACVAADLAANHIADIRDLDSLRRAMGSADPEIVIHMAAQPLVRASYAEPVETFTTNVIGTVNLLEVARALPSVQGVVVVTTDKCYENREWVWSYREVDRLGGRDPYSSSKACAEIATNAFRQSFFRKPGAAAVASARAGNVIGGGDWSVDRLIPDIVRGWMGSGSEVRLRNPGAVRPWQHVLEPLSGYLLLAERLTSGDEGYDESWNFGPDSNSDRAVIDVANAMTAALGCGSIVIDEDPNAPHEANLLRLDSTKSRARLGWSPKLSFESAIRLTSDWYSSWHRGRSAKELTRTQIREYQRI